MPNIKVFLARLASFFFSYKRCNYIISKLTFPISDVESSSSVGARPALSLVYNAE